MISWMVHSSSVDDTVGAKLAHSRKLQSFLNYENQGRMTTFQILAGSSIFTAQWSQEAA